VVSRRGRYRGGGARRSFMWVPFHSRGLTALASAKGTSSDLLGTVQSDLDAETRPGMTITRVIGYFYYFSATIGEQPAFTAGLQIVREAAGIPAGLSIDAEIERWLWWGAGICSQEGSEIAAGTFRAKTERMFFDVKGQWKLQAVGDEMIMGVQNHDGDEGVINWGIATRALVRLP